MIRVVALVLLLCSPAWGQDLERFCIVERLANAKAACLGVEADTRAERIEARIAAATSDLQAAFGPEIRTFEAQLLKAQIRWRAQVRADCKALAEGDKVAFQTCRLQQVLARDELVRETLDTARARLGASPAYDPDLESVEVLIPLPGLANGPDADLRVPLIVPIRP